MAYSDEDIKEAFSKVMMIGTDLARGRDMTSIATYSTTVSTGYPQQAFNLASLRRAAALVQEHEAKHPRRPMIDMEDGLLGPFGGVDYKESPLAISTAPVRKHKRRSNQTQAYHRRVQKKWTKRFGTHQVPCAYQIDGSKFGMESILVLHPEIGKKLREAAYRQGNTPV